MDFHTVVGEFVALRQEVKLLTRSTRNQQELNSETLQQLSRTVETLRQSLEKQGEAEVQAKESLLRPVVKALVDAYDSLTLAGREVLRAREAVLNSLEQLAEMVAETVAHNQRVAAAARRILVEPSADKANVAAVTAAKKVPGAAEPEPRRPPWWRRWFSGTVEPPTIAPAPETVVAEPPSPAKPPETEAFESERVLASEEVEVGESKATFETAEPEHAPESLETEAFESETADEPELDITEPKPISAVEPLVERTVQLLNSIVTGYTMSVQRLERTLDQQGLEAIPCVGEPFDPELMEVVDVVTGSGLPAGIVVKEVRRGYLWRGRLLRYAQVQVAKS